MTAVAERVSSSAVAARWLVRMRWHAVAGIAVAAAVEAGALDVGMALVPMVVLAAAVAVTNVVLARAVASEGLVGAVLVGDTAALTILLAVTGGPENPFAILYLVLISLAAQLLRMRWVAAVLVTAAVGYALLFVWHLDVPELAPLRPYALAVALAIGAVAQTLIVGRTTAAVRAHQAALDDAQRRLGRAETLAAVGTLATGAAHELGTPLGTIAIASSDLEQLVHDAPHEAAEEARVIRDEVERCRRIVERMAARAGVAIGEVPQPTTAAATLDALRDELPPLEARRLRIEIDGDDRFRCPVHGLVQVLANLVRNAAMASDPAAPVVIRAVVAAATVRFTVDDEGAGLPAEVLGRLGEPFVTTRPGTGMGLGLYFSRSFAELCGGTLEISARPGCGTRVVLELPRG